MNIYLCPKCGGAIDSIDEPCKHCGFPVQDLKLIFQNLGKYYIGQFYLSMSFHRKDEALKILGRLEFLDAPNHNLYLASYYYEDGSYNKAISILEGSDDLIITDELLSLEADLYSELGDIDKLNKVYINADGHAFSLYQLEYNGLKCLLNYPVEEWNNFYGDISWLNKVKIDHDADDIVHHAKLNLLFSSILYKAYECLIEYKAYEKSVENASIPLEKQNDIAIAKKVFSLYDAIENVPTSRVLELLDLDYINGIDNTLLVQEILCIINQWLYLANPLKGNAEYILPYFGFLSRLDEASYVRTVNNSINNFIELKKRGYSEVDSIIKSAYSWAIILNIDAENLKEYCDKSDIKGQINYVNKYEKGRILSHEAIQALKIAEIMYCDSQEKDYAWLDAGPISLSYFRILELEINTKLVTPWLNDETYDALQKKYTSEKNRLRSKFKEEYGNRWGQIISELKKVKDKEKNGLELGALHRLISNTDDTTDGLAVMIKEYFKKELSEAGMNALSTGMIADMISKEKRERYRNPPAHTRYLPYYIAVEARKYVLRSLDNIETWFNLGVVSS